MMQRSVLCYILIGVLVCSGLFLLRTTWENQGDDSTKIESDVQQQTKGPSAPLPIQTLPRFEPYQPELYPEGNFSSPFDMNSSSKEQFISPLQRIPLSKMKMMGSIYFRHQAWALITLPDGKMAQVGLGENLGSEGDKVISITEKSVMVAPTSGMSEPIELRLSHQIQKI